VMAWLSSLVLFFSERSGDSEGISPPAAVPVARLADAPSARWAVA
jgi:hypothetical protein